MRWLLAFGLVVGMGGPGAAQGLAVDCGNVEGDWTWLLGGTVRFDPDGTAIWSPRPAATRSSTPAGTATPPTAASWSSGSTASPTGYA
jgi:hypothetical protein